MGANKQESTRDFERRILKMEVKESVVEDLEEIIDEKLSVKVGPLVAEKLGLILNFPLTVKQLSEITGRTEGNIYKMCQRGQIPCTKVGRQLHINLKDLNIQLLRLDRQE